MTLDRRKLLLGLPAALPTALAGLAPWSCAPAAEPPPPHAGKGEPPPWRDQVLIDPGTRRRIRLRLRLPATDAGPLVDAGAWGERRPLIVYSPGLGSGLSNGAAWCEAWRQAGLVVATLAHPGTDEGIWDTSERSLPANVAAALAPAQYGHRVSDCRYAIRQCLTAMGLEAIIDPARIGIAGHSYGALTVQSLAGQAARRQDGFTIAGAIAFSPGGRSPAIGGVRMPFFCVTGDRDGTVTFKRGGQATQLGMALAYRLAVYRQLPAGAKQLLVLARADHMTFAGEPVSIAGYSRDIDVSEAANVRAWRRVSLATTAFWQHYLGPPPRPDRGAYLAQVRAQLDPADRLEAG